MSTLYRTPKPSMSWRSFSVMVGRSTTTPGRFMFFFSPRVKSFMTRTTTSLPPVAVHVHARTQTHTYRNRGRRAVGDASGRGNARHKLAAAAGRRAHAHAHTRTRKREHGRRVWYARGGGRAKEGARPHVSAGPGIVQGT